MLTFGLVAMGVSDVERATEFWSVALGYTPREGGFDGPGGKMLLPPQGGPGLPIGLQLSQTPPQEYPRVHFDLYATDPAEVEAEIARLVSLGAKRVDWDSYPDDNPGFTVLEDPDGNRFCIVDSSHD
jgi:catechol 2,3-dioxygenase-like lactoylglutathione lyase family enzyme